MRRLKQAYARHNHVGWLPKSAITALTLAVGAIALGSIVGPQSATARDGLSKIVDSGAKGATTPGGPSDEFQLKPGSKSPGRDKTPGAGIKDRDAGTSPQGPGCPYRKKSLELIV